MAARRSLLRSTGSIRLLARTCWPRLRYSPKSSPFNLPSSATVGFDLVSRKVEGWIVPDQAVVRSTQGAFVYLVKDGMVRIMPVKLLGMANGKAAISGELPVGAQVAVAQENKLLGPFRKGARSPWWRPASRPLPPQRQESRDETRRAIYPPASPGPFGCPFAVGGGHHRLHKMPFNLFPDVDRPQISVVTVMPGAAAADMEADISRTIEKELSTIDLVRRVTSTSKDEVSVVQAEFEYEKGLDAAATDVANALSKVAARLPAGDPAPPDLQDQPGHPAHDDPGPLPRAGLPGRPAQDPGAGRQPDQGRPRCASRRSPTSRSSAAGSRRSG